jgi:acyl-CoA synthetase (AMP-forming)/AMP-acid ligase II
MALNFADLFEHAADVFGERTAVVSGERQVTYRELDERTNRLAHHLTGMGVEAGGHVGLYAHNSIEAAETLIAACKLRAVAININYRYTENELQYMFADADLAALVCDRQGRAAGRRGVAGRPRAARHRGDRGRQRRRCRRRHRVRGRAGRRLARPRFPAPQQR